MAMIMKKNTNRELQKYLLAQLRKHSAIEGASSENNALNEMFIANLENLVKQGPQGGVSFDTTSYLMQKL